jgi:DNA repair protein RadC
MQSGLSGFQDYEVVELLLTLATPRKDCKEAAKAALKRFKTLQGVFEASPSELSEIEGIGPSNQFGIRLIKESSERYLVNRIVDSDVIGNAGDLLKYLNIAIRDKGKECFMAVYLNAKNRVIESEVLFTGTLTASSVYPREVVKSALDHKAAALIFAHNHPSGDPEPSPEDVSVTRKLVSACKVIDIPVHDHIILGSGRHYSFAENGFIAQFTKNMDEAP